MKARMQAKDIPDVAVLSQLSDYEFDWSFTWDPGITSLGPFKVVLAKLRALARRKLIDGCTCGCRGNFFLTPKGAEYLRAAGGQPRARRPK